MEYLTNTEELMMKCIWNYGKEMPFLRMGEELKDKFHKEYKRTSIRTYLFRLEDKGYIFSTNLNVFLILNNVIIKG